MSLEDLGNIGDFVGGVGVILTLLYLAVQIRQNTRTVEQNTLASKAQTRLQVTNDTVESIRSVRTNDALLQAFVKTLEEKDLDSTDNLVLSLYARELFRAAEGNFYQYRVGTIDDEEFQGIYVFYQDMFQQPHMKEFWSENKHQFPSVFVKEVDSMAHPENA